MILLLFITAILVSIVLERQERRHKFELSMEYQRLGRTAPEPKPKLTLTQAWFNIAVGAVISLMGLIFLVINITMIHHLGSNVNAIHMPVGDVLEWWSVVFAAGIALVIVGVKSVSLNRKYSSSNTTEELHSNVKITQTRD
ncbi:MAG: hypothetical protein EHM64_09265 [Ignavibacteriae bacterium]|nr:MAG: hypothetical protein EHM64_09265 [Ignavibacteriota bacterium]